ncbi:MAG: ABC transporter substrate-binding protein [Pseudomonadota bacterium]
MSADGSSFAQRLAVSSVLPRFSVAMPGTVDIGFLAPLSGQAVAWGLPGLQGCRIWERWINKAGGLMIDGRRYPVAVHARDSGDDPDAALASALSLLRDYDLKIMLMLGGDVCRAVAPALSARRILGSTLLPSDLSPDTPFLLAPSEVHPVYVVTGVDWLARTRPDLRRVALCAQQDGMGLPSLATYRAAFKAAGIEIVKEIQYPAAGAPAEDIVRPMLESSPDILCWCTSYTPLVHEMTEYACSAGYEGQILSCTFDHYDRLVERLGTDFMEDVTFQFPDFDDPALTEKAFFFNQPKAFYDEFMTAHPGGWTAVSLEYVAILDIWHAAVQKAGTSNPASVLAAMKQLGEVTHAFGAAEWWGEALFGIDNVLVGDWPVVTIRKGRARIAEFGSVPGWLRRHETLLRREMEALGQMWQQRMQHETSVELSTRSV